MATSKGFRDVYGLAWCRYCKHTLQAQIPFRCRATHLLCPRCDGYSEISSKTGYRLAGAVKGTAVDRGGK